ncbi:MAG: hypothetical protein JWM95_882 [Gemmatimonadetes bacterium]|nr:hypothetical protein [Gemmatimonadota bacterium]
MSEGSLPLYFASEPSGTAGAKRLLIISYAFPPDPQVGGRRWQQMARFLADAGWEIDVIARDFRALRVVDRPSLASLPRGTRIFTVPDQPPLVSRLQARWWPAIRTVVRFGRKRPSYDEENRAAVVNAEKPVVGSTFSRTYFARVEFSRDGNWARAAARLAKRLMQTGTYSAVVTSGPPHMTHEAGRQLTRALGVPHVLDMRDPWSLVERVPDYVSCPTFFRLAKQWEERFIDAAALVTMNTEAGAAAMRNAYPAAAHKIETVRNGCDDEPVPPTTRDRCFNIRFAGSIYLDRDPRLVFRAAALVIRDLGLNPAQLKLTFLGDVDASGGTRLLAEQEGVSEFVDIGPSVPRREILEFMAGAAMLLSLPQDSDFAIPAKIYEYMRFDAWMLVLATPQCATALVLENSGADVVDPSSVQGIARVIRSRYEQYARGEYPQSIAGSGRYDRSVQATKLIARLHQLEKSQP